MLVKVSLTIADGMIRPSFVIKDVLPGVAVAMMNT
jgi:hypothetical protein